MTHTPVPSDWIKTHQWHTIELPDGTILTGQVDYRGEAGNRFLLPDDLTGKSVIDFGTWTGFWAIEAQRRGASEVVAADRWYPMLPSAEKCLGFTGWDIPYLYTGDIGQPFDLAGEFFDVVLFYGILYHLKNPYQGLKNAADCCKPGGIVIVESAVDQGKLENLHIATDVPILWLIDETHHGDDSNYTMPNQAGLLQLCRMAGLVPEQTAMSEDRERPRMTVLCRNPLEVLH
jgi:tRNA (mo5U34)-methyltransferase